MKNSIKAVLLIVAMCSFLALQFWLSQKDQNHQRSETLKELNTLCQSVWFEGTVVSSPVYNHSTLLCIKIDTASVDSFYHFSRGLALCIREGVAVMPIGMIDPNNSTDRAKATAQRVIVNKDHSGNTLFIKGNDTLQQDFNLWPAKLKEVHLLMAWEDALEAVSTRTAQFWRRYSSDASLGYYCGNCGQSHSHGLPRRGGP